MAGEPWEAGEVARGFTGALTENTLNRNTTLKIYFQRWPGRAPASGVENAVADADKTVTYTYTVGGTAIITDRKIGPGGLVAIPVRMGGGSGTLQIFGTTYTVRARVAFGSRSSTPGYQRRLNALGFELGTADGVLGPKTDRSILNFQADNNPLDPDGRVGPLTRGDSSPPDGLKQEVDDQPK